MEAQGKAAFITGGAGGIGRAAALALAAAGAAVAVTDRDVAGGEETARQVVNAGGRALFVRADVTRLEELHAAVKETVETLGGLDYALNCAGVGYGDTDHLKPLAEADDDDWQRIMSINATGVYYSMKAEIPHMLAAGGGAIVNVSSVAGLVGAARMAAYAASKHAVVGLTRTAAVEYARSNIRVNAVCPAFIHTPLVDVIKTGNPAMYERLPRGIPMKRLGEPEEVAAAIVWLFSDAASFVTGHCLAVDGGLTAQ